MIILVGSDPLEEIERRTWALTGTQPKRLTTSVLTATPHDLVSKDAARRVYGVSWTSGPHSLWAWVQLPDVHSQSR